MNPFQTQYPLSPKKLTKKMIGTIVPSFIFSVLLSVFVPLALMMLSSGTTVMQYLGVYIGAVILIFIIIELLYSWYFKAYIRSYYYEGADNFITIRKNVFTPREIHVQYQKIQDVYVDQDLLDRMMGLYDVHIASATSASGLEAHIDGVEKEVAEALKNFFLQKIQSPNTQQQTPIDAATVGPAAPVVSAATILQSTGDISSTTYPIQPGWMMKSLIGMIFSSLFVGLLGAGYLSIRSSTAGLPFLPMFIVIAIVFFVFHLVGLLLWKHNYRFAFLPEYIQFNTGVVSLSETHLPYRSVQDVGISRSILDRMFGLANVKIENAAQVQVGRNGKVNPGITIVGQTPENANKITEAVKNIILTKDASHTGL